MGKGLKTAELTTAKARGRLPAGVYWRRLDAEAHIGFRQAKGGGTWLVRWRNKHGGSAYRQAPIGPANDQADKPAAGTLTFYEAEKLARERVSRARAEAVAQAAGPLLTVRGAVEDYVAARDRRDSGWRGRPISSNASSRMRRYVLGGNGVAAAPLADLPLHQLTEAHLIAWRAGLPKTLKASTRQRTVNDFRAALNRAYLNHRHRLDAGLPAIVRFGLRASDGDAESAEPIARSNQVLSDRQVGAVIQAAREVDDEQGLDGDFYRLIAVLAATGARFSQAARLTISHCQHQHGRLLVPASRKGRGSKSGAIPTPVGADILALLLPVTVGRAPDAFLLERWRYRRVSEGGTTRFGWQRTERGPWQFAGQINQPWQAVRDRVGMPALVAYSLRHSAIIRSIRAGLPLQLVGKMFDTSAQMVEAHYGAYVTTALEELAAKAIVPLILDEESDNVVHIARREPA